MASAKRNKAPSRLNYEKIILRLVSGCMKN
jgi:hypothetical protein